MKREVLIGTMSRVVYEKRLTRRAYIDICVDEAQKAGECGCDIFLLPELFDAFGSSEFNAQDQGVYEESTNRRDMYSAVSETIPGVLCEEIGAICRAHSMYIIANFIENDKGTLYNSAVLFGRSGLVEGVYRKTHLYPPEKRCYGIEPGNTLPVFDLDFGRIGIVICMDMFFPEIFRVLTLKGAEVIFWPHQTYGPSEEAIAITARARAIDYGCYLVGANFASPDYYAPYAPGHIYTGRAMIINPDGIIIADTGHYHGSAFARIDLATPRLGKDIISVRRSGVDDMREDMLACRRPELYADLVLPRGNNRVFEGQFLE